MLVMLLQGPVHDHHVPMLREKRDSSSLRFGGWLAILDYFVPFPARVGDALFLDAICHLEQKRHSKRDRHDGSSGDQVLLSIRVRIEVVALCQIVAVDEGKIQGYTKKRAEQFDINQIVPLYEQFYKEVIANSKLISVKALG